MNKTALITGITGQDGSYLAELLLEDGYIVHGIKRRSSSLNTNRINHLYNNKNLKLYYGDITDPLSISDLVSKIKPDILFNLAAQSHVMVSFEQPYYTSQVDAIGTLNILEAVKNHSPNTKIYQASTSELYGKTRGSQNEETPFNPQSPYAVAKQYSYWMCENYKKSYDMFISNGILFNHCSPRRGETFVTRKITRAVGNIKNGNQEKIYLGNLNSLRDWGHAKDYVHGMYLMMLQDNPSNYVLATNTTHSVRDFCEESFKHIDRDITWEGDGLDERGIDQHGNVVVEVDQRYFRPSEVGYLKGDYSKAEKELGWKPTYLFEGIVEEMVKHDIKNN